MTLDTRFKTISENWEHFNKVDIAPTAPQVQRDEMQRAFLAGVSSGIVLTIMANEQPASLEAIKKLVSELEMYIAVFRARRREG